MDKNYEKLMQTVFTNYAEKDVELLDRAYAFAEKAHASQKRFSGEPYIVHPVATALILARMKLSFPIVIAGLLHDTLEDTPAKPEEIRAQFGDNVADMVEGVTKLGNVKYRGIERYAENLRKMFIAVAKDLPVIIIKFADRIHNLSTLEYLPVPKRRRIALESLEIYAPIANRLGIANMRVELEDLAFKFAYPDEYRRVADMIGQKYASRDGYLDRTAEKVRTKLSEAGIASIVSMQARTKHYLSIYKKLMRYEWDINHIWDLFALRIVAEDVPDCYAALGVIHSAWKPVKGRVKDYIAQPKPNGYRSLHTTVFCDEGEFVEFQIRTQEMHEEAQYGLAAHWRYDENKGRERPVPQREIDWIKELVGIQKEVESNKEFLETLEHLKIDAFKNRIFVYTPKGDVIELPEEATPVDFAYAIHSDIGNKAVAAIVNSAHANLDTPLKSGDIVQIITDKNRKGPSADWLKFSKTRMARSHIKSGSHSKLSSLLEHIVPGKKRGK
jgi:GTP diphosphokinase / guanosine-3',5'-bis(diphosphate) 3'-diphosphatase